MKNLQNSLPPFMRVVAKTDLIKDEEVPNKKRKLNDGTVQHKREGVKNGKLSFGKKPESIDQNVSPNIAT